MGIVVQPDLEGHRIPISAPASIDSRILKFKAGLPNLALQTDGEGEKERGWFGPHSGQAHAAPFVPTQVELRV